MRPQARFCDAEKAPKVGLLLEYNDKAQVKELPYQV